MRPVSLRPEDGGVGIPPQSPEGKPGYRRNWGISAVRGCGIAGEGKQRFAQDMQRNYVALWLELPRTQPILEQQVGVDMVKARYPSQPACLGAGLSDPGESEMLETWIRRRRSGDVDQRLKALVAVADASRLAVPGMDLRPWAIAGALVRDGPVARFNDRADSLDCCFLDCCFATAT
jgi:hypothetical protein